MTPEALSLLSRNQIAEEIMKGSRTCQPKICLLRYWLFQAGYFQEAKDSGTNLCSPHKYLKGI